MVYPLASKARSMAEAERPMATVHSMMKRNRGSVLRGKTTGGRERGIRLKVLAHNAMILEAFSERIETEQESSFRKK